jgi:two-component sensor histidine kinase
MVPLRAVLVLCLAGLQLVGALVIVGLSDTASERGLLVAALVLAAAAAGVGLVLARSLARPAGILQAQAERLAGGTVEPMPPLDTPYREIGGAGAALARMTAWLNLERVDQEALAERLREDARALEARLAERTAELDAAEARLEEARDQAKLLAQELNHRVKNLFAIISAIVTLSAGSARSAEELARTTRRRIEALSRAHMLTQGPGASGQTVDLGRLAQAVLEPYARAGSRRIEMGGPEVALPAQATTSLGLILHELATNAVKYGALSREGGLVGLAWETAPAESGRRVVLEWREEGGPEVEKPARDGFGSQLIRQVATQFRAELDIDWRRQGLVARLSMDVPSPEAARAAPSGSAP